MRNQKIQLSDTTQDVIFKMSEGNPGALTAIMEMMMTQKDEFVFKMIFLDSLRIYGTDIYVLWSDICGRDINKMVSVLEATQRGLFDSKLLARACSKQDYSGREMVPVDELCAKLNSVQK